MIVHNDNNLPTIPIANLLPTQGNLKDLTEKNYSKLKGRIEHRGFSVPVYVWEDDNGVKHLLDGHQRRQVLTTEGWNDPIPYLKIPAKDLQEAMARLLEITSQYATITQEGIDEFMATYELNEAEVYEATSFDALTSYGETEELEVEEDEAPEVDESEPPKSKLGEIYQLGRHRVMCGDSRVKENVDLLMKGDKADMVFTDPPYGMDLDADYADIHTSRDTTALGGGKQRSHTNYDKVIGDSGDFDFSCIATICDMADEVFLWGADYYIDSVPNTGKGGSWIVWNKKPKGDMGKAIGNQFEICWSKQKHKRIVIDYTYSGAYGMKPNDGNRVHPTQKPIDLIAQMFERWGKDKQNIIDLFLGSGSTLIACEQTDRTCYGMELDEKYLDVVRKRWAKYVYPDRWEEEWESLTPMVK